MKDIGEFLERLGRTIGRIDAPRGWDWLRDEEEGELGSPRIERELPLGETPEVDLTASTLSLRIVPVEPGQQPRITLQGRGAEGADLRIERQGEKVVVSIQRAGELWGWAGRLRAVMAVPAGTRLRVRFNAGRLRVLGLQDAEFDLRLEAGLASFHDCSGRLLLAVNAGKVDLHDFSGLIDAHADASALNLRDVHLRGDSSLRSNAGAIRCERLRLDPGTYQLETSAGSMRIGLLPGLPISITASATLGSVSNRIGGTLPGAPVQLNAHTEMGNIRLYYDEPPATPLRPVPITDERAFGPRPAEPPEPPTAPPPPEPFTAATPATGSDDEAATDVEAETLRILGMVERHEITTDEAAALLAALRERQER